MITETTDNQRTAQDLLRAVNLLQTQGWIKGWYKSSDGFCSVGALRSATEGSGEIIGGARYIQARNALKLAAGLDHSTTTIPEWNDAPERTKQEVVSAFRRAAHSLDPSISLNQSST